MFINCLRCFCLVLISVALGCTSTSNKQQQVSEARNNAQQEKKPEGEVDATEAAAAGPMEQLYRVDYRFDRVRDQLVAATSAKRNEFSIFEYDLEYIMFARNREGETQRFGIARVASIKDSEQLLEVASPANGRAVKHLFIGQPTPNGYCGACFAGRSQIHFLIGLSAVGQDQQPLAFQTTAFKILRDGEQAIRIVPDFRTSRGPGMVGQVKSFSIDQNRLELVYQPVAGEGVVEGTQDRLVIRMNRTLDSQLFRKLPGSDEFKMVAEYRGGRLPNFAIN